MTRVIGAVLLAVGVRPLERGRLWRAAPKRPRRTAFGVVCGPNNQPEGEGQGWVGGCPGTER